MRMTSWSMFRLPELGVTRIESITLEDIVNERYNKVAFSDIKLISEYDFKKRLLYTDLGAIFSRTIEEYMFDNK